ELRQCVAGESWDWDGVHFRIVSPAAAMLGPPEPRGDNDRSCVLLIEGTGGRLLLTGDITSRIEPRVAEEIRTGTPLVLAVAHHGSRGSSSAVFIAAAQPTLAIVSAGWHSRYGHPHAETVERFHDARVALRNTAGQGAITVEFPATGRPFARSERERRHYYWRERSEPP
ncbi:MAG TPA: DNA internalization-related competence protein ComEC/Rec2, partial [Rhodanobacteraceae bacterium]|nr:DNA internalization-related competence protein ComEC/Rec2 [Rhodanobacteraceae bacterium]